MVEPNKTASAEDVEVKPEASEIVTGEEPAMSKNKMKKLIKKEKWATKLAELKASG